MMPLKLGHKQITSKIPFLRNDFSFRYEVKFYHLHFVWLNFSQHSNCASSSEKLRVFNFEGVAFIHFNRAEKALVSFLWMQRFVSNFKRNGCSAWHHQIECGIGVESEVGKRYLFVTLFTAEQRKWADMCVAEHEMFCINFICRTLSTLVFACNYMPTTSVGDSCTRSDLSRANNVNTRNETWKTFAHSLQHVKPFYRWVNIRAIIMLTLCERRNSQLPFYMEVGFLFCMIFKLPVLFNCFRPTTIAQPSKQLHCPTIEQNFLISFSWIINSTLEIKGFSFSLSFYPFILLIFL